MASGLKMDQETALDLVKNGATLLLLDVPQFTLFGIDTQMFSVGPNFKGIKMVPPGPHFIYYSPSNKEGNEFSPTVGFFLTTQPAEVVVRRWHQQYEWMTKLSEDEEYRYSDAVKRFEFDQQLGPYALDHYGAWKQLSSYITKNVIERIEPIGGDITIAYESGIIDKAPKTAMERRLMEQLRNSKFSKNAAKESHKRGCYYTTIPHAVKSRDVFGEELTALNLDKTNLLESVLMKDYGDAEDLLLGELQFAFIAFMVLSAGVHSLVYLYYTLLKFSSIQMGQSLEAFLQWKALVSLLFSCTEAPFRTRTQLFSKFLRVIYFQLKHGFHENKKDGNAADNGISVFLDDAWFSRDIFLYGLCKEFFLVVLESPVVDGDLLLWTRKLKRLLETVFGWDFEDNAMGLIFEEDDEFSPVIAPSNEVSPNEGPSA